MMRTASRAAGQPAEPASAEGKPTPKARLRIGFAGGLQLGPGKIELLSAIDRTGSISAAGREMGMSYRRAWLLVDAANRLFKRPLVTVSVGGAQGGGAELTDLGRAVISAYRRIEARTDEAIRDELAALAADLAHDADRDQVAGEEK